MYGVNRKACRPRSLLCHWKHITAFPSLKSFHYQSNRHTREHSHSLIRDAKIFSFISIQVLQMACNGLLFSSACVCFCDSVFSPSVSLCVHFKRFLFLLAKKKLCHGTYCTQEVMSERWKKKRDKRWRNRIHFQNIHLSIVWELKC